VRGEGREVRDVLFRSKRVRSKKQENRLFRGREVRGERREV